MLIHFQNHTLCQTTHITSLREVAAALLVALSPGGRSRTSGRTSGGARKIHF